MRKATPLAVAATAPAPHTEAASLARDCLESGVSFLPSSVLQCFLLPSARPRRRTNLCRSRSRQSPDPISAGVCSCCVLIEKQYLHCPPTALQLPSRCVPKRL